MKKTFREWQSRSLGRKMQVLTYGDRGMRLLAFPPRMGVASDYEDKGVVEALGDAIERGMFQFISFDTVDSESFYCVSKSPRERIERHIQYEAFLLHELIPFTHRRNPNPALAAFGCSLGAYHALNLVMRHPRRFCRLIALSGRYDLTTTPPDFWNLFGGYYDEDVFFHTPTHFLPHLVDPEILDAIRRLHITLVIGDEDPFLDNNQAISGIFDEKCIPYQMHIWSGRAHRFRYWRQMAKLFV